MPISSIGFCIPAPTTRRATAIPDTSGKEEPDMGRRNCSVPHHRPSRSHLAGLACQSVELLSGGNSRLLRCVGETSLHVLIEVRTLRACVHETRVNAGWDTEVLVGSPVAKLDLKRPRLGIVCNRCNIG